MYLPIIFCNVLFSQTRNGLYLTASKLESPNPACFVCRNATTQLKLNTKEWTLERLLKTVVKGWLGFEAPTVLIDGDFVWEEGDGADSEEFAINLPKALDKLPCGGIQHGTVFELDDSTQHLTVQVSVVHQEEWPDLPEEEREEFPFVVGGPPPKRVATSAAPDTSDTEPAAQALEGGDDVDDDDVVLVVDEEEGAKKRPAAPADGEAPPAKKQKVSDPDIIEIL